MALRRPAAGSLNEGVMGRLLLLPFLALSAYLAISTAQAQQLGSAADDVQKGHQLAALVCSTCHMAAPDQPVAPVLQPPAPSFQSIAQRSSTSGESLRAFLTTTHRNVRNSAGMPNPALNDSQIGQVDAYLLSLRSTAAAPAGRVPAAAPQPGSCRTEITRLELLLTQSHASGKPIGSEPVSSAARLHSQPTAQSVQRAADEATHTVETALTLARALESQGLDAECSAMLKNVEQASGLQ